jgi:hypothetical protein
METSSVISMFKTVGRNEEHEFRHFLPELRSTCSRPTSLLDPAFSERQNESHYRDFLRRVRMYFCATAKILCWDALANSTAGQASIGTRRASCHSERALATEESCHHLSAVLSQMRFDGPHRTCAGISG